MIRMRFLFLIFIFYGAFSVWAQVHTFLNVQVENDFINWWGKGSDRYYTGGNFISVQRIWQNKAVCLIGTELVQKAYTPSNLQAIKVEEMDFPYAGLLFMRNFILISPAQKKWTLLLRISSGTSGPRSGVALFQKRIHQWIGDEAPQGWTTMQSSYPYRQIDINFCHPLQLSSRVTMGIAHQWEGGTFYNRWVGQTWLFIGSSPVIYFVGTDSMIPVQWPHLSNNKKITGGLLIAAGIQYVVRDRIIEESVYSKTVFTPPIFSDVFLDRSIPQISGSFFFHRQNIAFRFSQHWRAASLDLLPSHFYGAIGFSFHL